MCQNNCAVLIDLTAEVAVSEGRDSMVGLLVLDSDEKTFEDVCQNVMKSFFSAL